MDSDVTASELECRAENTNVHIIPNFDLEKLELLSGTFGPFEASIPAEVPLWLGLFLKKRNKCRVLPPPWMDLEALDLKLQEEHSVPSLSAVDFHYLEIAALVLNAASDDVRHKAQVRKAVEDLFTLRMSKLRNALKSLKSSSKAVNLTNAASMELQMFRSTLTELMSGLTRLRVD